MLYDNRTVRTAGGHSDDAATMHRYGAPEKVRGYRSATAHAGKRYMLETFYVPLLVQEAQAALRESGSARLSVVEFGCGAGMVIHALMEELGRRRFPIESAVGADLVPEMIDAARSDLAANGTEWAQERLRFVVARHEELATQLPRELGRRSEDVEASFQLAFGLSTFRYSLEAGTAAVAVDQLGRLLAPGGHVVMIDVNPRFPFGLKHSLPRTGAAWQSQRYRRGPTLDDYAGPFCEAGFEILLRKCMWWIPHSLTSAQLRIARALSPILDVVAPGRAMRVAIVARKPLNRSLGS